MFIETSLVKILGKLQNRTIFNNLLREITLSH